MKDEPEPVWGDHKPEWVNEDSALAPVEVELREIGEICKAGFGAVLSAIVILTPPALMTVAGWYIGSQFRHPFEEIGAVVGVLLGTVFFLGVVDHMKEQ